MPASPAFNLQVVGQKSNKKFLPARLPADNWVEGNTFSETKRENCSSRQCMKQVLSFPGEFIHCRLRPIKKEFFRRVLL